MVLPVVAFYIVALYQSVFFDYPVCCDGLSAFAGLIVYFGFRNNKLFIHNDFIIKQSGSWDIDNAIIEPLKISNYYNLTVVFGIKGRHWFDNNSTAGGF
jgi:putative membrane protein